MSELNYELEAIHDSRASFYGKARVQRTTEVLGALVERLYSYDTLVLSYITDPDSMVFSMKIHGWYSATTARHINEYLRQRGYHGIPKSRIQELTGEWFDPSEELEVA
jgi:hypothetical protein